MSARSTSHNVRVVCRIRPTNQKERDEKGVVCVTNTDRNIDITVGAEGLGFGSNSTFTFDKVFGGDSKQIEVYEDTAASLVTDVMQGYNATIFAYGQTGAGKTHTMEGDISDPEMKGIVPRSISAIFDAISSADDIIEFSIKVSFVEIYLEKIRDLLDSTHTKNNLAVREDKVKGIYISGCNEEFVASVEELLELMKYGATNRAKAATSMNAGSSRSHSIFTVVVTQRDTVRNSSKTGKLVLVDLAGSETVKKTNAAGAQLDEAITINKSLSALGQVINALTDRNAQHIPYRDSKLTRVLQDSLGGNAKTVLIIAISPSSYNASESVSTLRFGMRAKSIENKVKINQTRSVEELELLLAKAEKVIEALQLQVATLKAGGKLEDLGLAPPPPPFDSVGRSSDASYSSPAADSRGVALKKKVSMRIEEEDGEDEEVHQIATGTLPMDGDNIDALLDELGPMSPTTRTLARANSRRLRGGSQAKFPSIADLTSGGDSTDPAAIVVLEKAAAANLAKIQELERVQTGLISEKSQLMQSNSELASKLIEAHHALEHLSHIQDETAALEDEIDALHKHLNDKTKECVQLSDKLGANDASNAEHVCELTSALELLTVQVTESSATVENLRAIVAEKEAAMSELTESHNAAMKVVEKQIQDLHEELDESRTNVIDMSSNVVTLSGQRTADREMIDKLQRDLDALRSDSSAKQRSWEEKLQKEHELAENSFSTTNELEVSVARFKAQVNELDADLKVEKAEHDKIAAEAEALKQALQEKEDELNRLIASSSAEDRANKSVVAKLTKDLEKEWTNAAERLEHINELKRKAVEKDGAVMKLEGQIQQLTLQHDTSQSSQVSSISKLKRELDASSEQVEAQAEKIRSLEEQLAGQGDLSKKIMNLTAENGDYKLQLQKLSSELAQERLQASKKLTEIASSTHQETEALYQQLEQASHEAAEYRGTLQQRDQELRQLNEKMVMKERIAKDATEMIHDLQARNDNLMQRSEKLLHEKFDIVRELENLRVLMEEELTHSKHNLLDMEGNILVLEAENKHLKSLLVQLDPNFE